MSAPTYTITLPPEPLALRVIRLERPAAPAAAPRTSSAQLSRRERLLAGYAQIQDQTLRAAFRRRWWREIL
jgi:hypothetical protein